MNRSELREFVRETGTFEEHVISEAGIDRYLDEGYGRVTATAKWPWLYRTMRRITSGESEVELNSFASGVYGVHLDGKALRELTHSRMLQSQAMDRPVRGAGVYSFNLSGLADRHPTVVIHPSPPSRSELIIDFVEMPAFASGDDAVPPWDGAFHSILADWALHRIWEKEEDMDLSDKYRQRYALTLSEMIRFYRVVGPNEPDNLDMMGGGNGSS